MVTRLEEQMKQKQARENSNYEELQAQYNELYKAFRTLQEAKDDANGIQSPAELPTSHGTSEPALDWYSRAPVGTRAAVVQERT